MVYNASASYGRSVKSMLDMERELLREPVAQSPANRRVCA